MTDLKRLLPLLLLPTLPLHAETLVPPPNAESITQLVVRAMPQRHLSHEELTESLVRRMLDNFLRALDFDRTIFLEEDILALRKASADLENDLREGNVEFAFRAFDLYKKRAANRVAFVGGLLEDGFEMDKDEEVERVQAEYLALAQRLWDGLDPVAPEPMEDRDLFELLGFD